MSHAERPIAISFPYKNNIWMTRREREKERRPEKKFLMRQTVHGSLPHLFHIPFFFFFFFLSGYPFFIFGLFWNKFNSADAFDAAIVASRIVSDSQRPIRT